MNKISEKILKTKKYKDIYPKTVDRIVEFSIAKYGEKRAEDEAKRTLHQIWGAFYTSRPDFNKLIFKLNKLKLKDPEVSDNILKELLWIHSSTAERANFIEDFYKKIIEITDYPKSVIDLACGFNPFAIKKMNLLYRYEYTAYDIDVAEINFLKKAFDILKIGDIVNFKVGDVLIDKFDYADIIFLLKTLPVLEMQQKGATELVLDKLKCKFLVVSFPLKSLSGKDVGMGDFYSKNFENILGDRNLHYEKLEFENELVYVVKMING